MAGFDPQLITGGGQSTLYTAPDAGSGMGLRVGSLGSPQPHHGLIGIVVLAVIVLIALDKAGFRFAVTVGRH